MPRASGIPCARPAEQVVRQFGSIRRSVRTCPRPTSLVWATQLIVNAMHREVQPGTPHEEEITRWRMQLHPRGVTRCRRDESLAEPKPANPRPLGLSAFALTTFLFSMVNARFQPGQADAFMVVSLTQFYGGIAQFGAGMWTFGVGELFGAAFCLCCSWSAKERPVREMSLSLRCPPAVTHRLTFTANTTPRLVEWR